MGKTGSTLRNVFIWVYARGTIPYDIICALILLFVFLTPRSCYVKRPAAAQQASQAAGVSQSK